MSQELKTARRVLETLVAPGLTTEKEWLMSNPTCPTPAASREPQRLGISLPDGASINIEWHGDDRVPLATAGDLLDMLSLVDRDTPVWLAMEPQHGGVDHLQIGGHATWL